MRVYKYPLEITDRQVVSILRGAEPLHIDMQDGQLCLWARVNDSLKADDTEQRIFVVAGTGHALPDEDLFYCGSALAMDGALVWHVFEEDTS